MSDEITPLQAAKAAIHYANYVLFGDGPKGPNEYFVTSALECASTSLNQETGTESEPVKKDYKTALRGLSLYRRAQIGYAPFV